MADGGGNYADELRRLYEETEAVAVFLIVVGGNKGQGVAFRGPDNIRPVLASILHDVAGQIEIEVALEASKEDPT